MDKFSISESQFPIKFKNRGYTLIEILVGLTIVGILFSFGYVSFRDFSRREALSGTSKKVQGDLRFAQSMALAGQKPEPPNDAPCTANRLIGYNFKVYATNEYKIEAVCGATAVTVKDVVLSGDVLISSPSTNPILFKVLGNGTNIVAGAKTTLTLTQTGTNSTATITITAGGEIK